MNNGITKLYYSIGEVSQIIDVKKHVLRYWEDQFDLLSPSKNSAGNRVYKKQDINLVKLIKHLLYEKKYTIEGANKVLQNLSADEIKQYGQQGEIEELDNTTKNKLKQYEEVVRNIRKELKNILDVLKKDK